MKIITGATGKAHVEAKDDRALNIAYAGANGILLADGYEKMQFPNYSYPRYYYVGATQGCLAAQLESSNSVRIWEGDVLIQGCQGRIPYGSSEAFTIDPGQTGYNRIDLIVAHYHKNSVGTESIELKLLKGTPTTGTAEPPKLPVHSVQFNSDLYTESINDAYLRLYSISLVGTKVNTPQRMAQYIIPIQAIAWQMDDISAKYNLTASLLADMTRQGYTDPVKWESDWPSGHTEEDQNVQIEKLKSCLLKILQAWEATFYGKYVKVIDQEKTNGMGSKIYADTFNFLQATTQEGDFN